ncbi:hypothetical protein H2203_005723 [Taxawa tesnikishii (nom. ined.)]|nr:hypothetical protein H2203_005723 [Dothideales sp. JES 119]
MSIPARLLAPSRKDDRIVIHFDYDCFYASVFEASNPALKYLPLAVQQKQIIVTCNYEARRRGLRKLQLVKDAKNICPDVVIVLGRISDGLGMPVWMDVTDIVDYNLDILNPNAPRDSFFQLDKDDPTKGFPFDASENAGHTYPPSGPSGAESGCTDAAPEALTRTKDLGMRLRLGSHLAMHIRHRLEDDKGYTATVGISTNKLLAKLVGNVHKPRAQTVLLPPYTSSSGRESNVTAFMDAHNISKIPGIGSKIGEKLRRHVHPPAAGSVGGESRNAVLVRDLRTSLNMSAERLEALLAGPGAPRGIGYRIWCLLHGVDDTEVAAARRVPRQISIEDSYLRLDSAGSVIRELTTLSASLVERMRIDLVDDDDDDDDDDIVNNPTTDGETGNGSPAPRSFKRISQSCPLPAFVFDLDADVATLAGRLVRDALVPLFRRLHPERKGWDLSLINVAVTNMVEAAGEGRGASGRDIGGMFRRQEDGMEGMDEETGEPEGAEGVEEDVALMTEDDGDDEAWDEQAVLDSEGMGLVCDACGTRLPAFAMPAHRRYHELGD